MTTPRANDNTRGGIIPRGLRRVDAAAYICISPSLFDEMVRDGRMPGPRMINSRTVWDRFELDEAFDALPRKKGCQPVGCVGATTEPATPDERHRPAR